MKHTPGPWILGHNLVDPAALQGTSVHKGGEGPNWRICTMSRAFPNDERLANAQLIATAPDLLAACKALAKPSGGLYVLPNYHYLCAYCGAPPHRGHPNDFEHFDDCPVLLARAAIAAAEPEGGNDG